MCLYRGQKLSRKSRDTVQLNDLSRCNQLLEGLFGLQQISRSQKLCIVFDIFLPWIELFHHLPLNFDKAVVEYKWGLRKLKF